MEITPLVHQLLQRIADKGTNPKRLAIDAGLNENAVRDIIVGNSKNPRIDTIRKIADALNCSVEELTASVPRPEEQPIGLGPVIVVGAVQAGIWRDAVEWPTEDQFVISVPPDDRYLGIKRFGLQVRGASMDRLYPIGTVLVCVPFAEIGGTPKTGDRVVCIRRNHDGLVEATVKEFVIDDQDRAWLWPRSHQPEFQQPWPLPADEIPMTSDMGHVPATVHAGYFDLDEGAVPTVYIAALVTGSYRRE